MSAMYIRRFLSAVLVMSTLSSCGSDSWFGKEKKLDMPGERQPLVIRSKDLFISNNGKVGTIALPSPQVNCSWNGAFNQFSTMHSNLSWNTCEAANKSTRYSNQTFLVQPSIPSIEGDRLFAMSADGIVKAYDTTSGAEVWSNIYFANEESGGFFDFLVQKFLNGGVKKDGNVIYATAGIAKIVAIDASDGKTIWEAGFSSPIRSVPLIVDELLIVQSIDNKMYALNKSDGSSVWTYMSNFEDLSSLAVSTPLQAGNYIVAKFSNDEVVALDKSSGEEFWSNGLVSQQKFGLIARSNFNSNNSFHLGDGYLVTSNAKGNIFKLDLQTGNVIWNKDVAATGKSWLSGNYLFFISSANDLVCLDMHDGSAIWILNLNMFDEAGKLIPDLYISNPVLANNHIYVLNNKGELIKVDAVTGAKTQVIKISESAYLGPIFANDHMFIVTNRGDLEIF